MFSDGITFADLKQIMSSLGEKISDKVRFGSWGRVLFCFVRNVPRMFQEIEDMIKIADKTGSGKVRFADFEALMLE